MTATAARRAAPSEPEPTGPGPARPRPLLWAGSLGACAVAALAIAIDAGVEGAGSLGPATRAIAAGFLVYGLCGLAPTLVLARGRLVPWWPLLVLPVGAMTSGLALTILGFAFVPYGVSLALVLAAGAASSLWAWRTRRPPASAAEGGPAWRHVGAVALVAGLIAAVALVPYFRSGFATVTGFGSDAHQVTGSALFLQHDHPAARNPTLPIDRVQVTWRSKYPIYYSLAAVSSVSGLETHEAMTPLMALLCALVATGWFLFARLTLGAALGIALLAMGLAALDRQTFHVTLHPYYNQLWGLLTLPFSLLLAREWVETLASWRTLALLSLFLLVGVLAYPLMLPFPLLALVGFLLHRPDFRSGGRSLWRSARRRARELPRRFWIGLAVAAPLLFLILLIPLVGVGEKVKEAVEVLSPGNSLVNWQGDLLHYPPMPQFFGIPAERETAAGFAAVAAIVALAFVGFGRAPRAVGRPLRWIMVAALLAAVYFRIVPLGQYFMFKVLTFSGPILLCGVALALGAAVAARRRAIAALGAAGACGLALAATIGASQDISHAFDQLRPDQLELAGWTERIPEDSSIRLDVDEGDQIWTAYFLAPHPLGSRQPLTVYPHVPHSVGADYALDRVLTEPPDDAADPRPTLTNGTYRLWRLDLERRPDGTSRRQVPVFDVGAVSGG